MAALALGLTGSTGLLSIYDPSESVFTGEPWAEAIPGQAYQQLHREVVEPPKDVRGDKGRRYRTGTLWN